MSYPNSVSARARRPVRKVLPNRCLNTGKIATDRGACFGDRNRQALHSQYSGNDKNFARDSAGLTRGWAGRRRQFWRCSAGSLCGRVVRSWAQCGGTQRPHRRPVHRQKRGLRVGMVVRSGPIRSAVGCFDRCTVVLGGYFFAGYGGVG